MMLECRIGSLAFQWAETLKIAIIAPDVQAPREKAPVNNSLTPAERTLVPHLVEGRTNDEIARELGISPHTIKFHMNSVIRKLGGRNRVYAAVQAVRLGLA